jgi:dipeptidyl aminopeptidase/acylaminoacyl peptidase
MRFPVWLAGTMTVAAPALAPSQTPRRVTADRYARAEQFLPTNTSPLVFGADVRVRWLPDGRAWYRNSMPEGTEYVVVDPARRTRGRAFDHERLAAALARAADTAYAAFKLPPQLELTTAESAVMDLRLRRFLCDLRSYECTVSSRNPADTLRNRVLSPDGSTAAFLRDWNLWVRDVASGTETQLTTDGMQDFGYATDNAGWVKSDNPVLVWSPDSKRIATFQHDSRGVGEMYLVSTNVGHPRLEAWKYPLPEDTVIFRISRVVIHLEGPRVVRLHMPPDAHRSTRCDHVRCGGTWADVEWSPDGAHLAFVSTSRDHKHAVLRVADPETGAVRDVLEERVATFYESGYNAVNWRVLHATGEVIWYSQRDDWGHLYLYDLATGRLKHQITSGSWNVLNLMRVDEQDRTLYFTGAGREPGDPYFQYFYSIGLDGKNLRLLTPDAATHTIQVAPSGRHFVDSYSTPVTPPVTVLRDARGRTAMALESADISRLATLGWQPPLPFTVKARDRTTDLFGLMYRPTDFDSTRSYPVINYLYPGPQSGSVGSRSFSASRGDKQALAELGFVVVELDAMGTPMRSKSFHAAYYGNMGDNGIPDQITAIEQLAARHPWMDLEHVGIWGHSGGGYASADAIMRYPGFYKVAVSQAGNHDNRNYEDDWGEKWQGLLEQDQGGATNYDNQANQLLAKNLKGKLLIAHGTMDNNVPPYNTLLVVDALIAANKDFDLLLLPNRRHGFGNESYMMRRRWDYFVRHLMGAEPPEGYEIGRRTRLTP